ncbi:hypothetical protein B9Z19DRAFT_1085637 [Tuber borchii]|uniref:Uncharacterized protein n=1 Tax=Tuber borchii TaxID=42251 RepID=A0A2T6ZQI6_TUBBO|nr:hypothetical protein B9Z19DRAFT_1085637 [Tuber borchii]
MISLVRPPQPAHPPGRRKEQKRTRKYHYRSALISQVGNSARVRQSNKFHHKGGRFIVKLPAKVRV